MVLYISYRKKWFYTYLLSYFSTVSSHHSHRMWNFKKKKRIMIFKHFLIFFQYQSNNYFSVSLFLLYHSSIIFIINLSSIHIFLKVCILGFRRLKIIFNWKRNIWCNKLNMIGRMDNQFHFCCQWYICRVTS